MHPLSEQGHARGGLGRAAPQMGRRARLRRLDPPVARQSRRAGLRGRNRPLRDHDQAQFEATVDRWVQAFADSNTARIASGAIVLRKRSGSNWIRVDEARTYPAAQAGRHLEQLFAGQTLVAALPDDRDLLELVVSPHDGLRLDQTEAETPNGAELLAARLRIKDGVPLIPRLTRR